MITIGLVAQSRRERAGFRTVLEADTRYRVVGEEEPGREAALLCRHAPRVVVVSQPGEDAALAALQRIKAAPGPSAALLLADRFTRGGLRRILECHPAGILHRRTAAAHLPWAAQAAAQGGPVLDPKLVTVTVGTCAGPECASSQGAEAQGLLRTLSARESEVLALASDGLSNPEIATALTISSDTAKEHLRNIYVKLGVRSRLQAARIAWQAAVLRRSGGGRAVLSYRQGAEHHQDQQ